MQHAFLITAYKDPKALIELIGELGPKAQIHIHWDRRSHLSGADEATIRSEPTVRTLSQRYVVNWGSTRHLLAILELARAAIRDPAVDRIHSISGSDRPTRSTEAFDRYFETHPKSEFLEFFTLPTKNWRGGGLDRLSLYHPLDLLNVHVTNHARIRNLLIKVQRKLKVDRSLRSLPPLYGGSTWWSLTRNCLVHVLDRIDREKHLLDRFRMTHIPEEIFFQTLIMDSPFASHVVNDNLRYIDWNTRNGNVPAVLDMSDLEKILVSNKLFARKLEHPISTQLMKELSQICAAPSGDIIP